MTVYKTWEEGIEHIGDKSEKPREFPAIHEDLRENLWRDKIVDSISGLGLPRRRDVDYDALSNN